jgi:hypothetical protein
MCSVRAMFAPTSRRGRGPVDTVKIGCSLGNPGTPEKSAAGVTGKPERSVDCPETLFLAGPETNGRPPNAKTLETVFWFTMVWKGPDPPPQGAHFGPIGYSVGGLVEGSLWVRAEAGRGA